MTKRTFLFLDIDDVLNSDSFLEKKSEELKDIFPKDHPREFIDPEAVAHLNEIFDRACPKPTVILSSTWRHEFEVAEINSILGDRGFTHTVEDRIPGRPARRAYGWGSGRRQNHDRGVYIESFLEHTLELNVAKIDGIVVIDNLPLEELEPFEDFVVQTQPEHGLLDDHVNEALEVLEKPFVFPAESTVDFGTD